ncbi:CaiB/BaiF CoA transferase family protein [Pseudomaricurvus sp.]|uniref:CaiB/BaiF CoA transferase family protein n=1 Tax=Pseudomaricurvus sp. TaxID=2004510 RepID=UPI003F6ADFFE
MSALTTTSSLATTSALAKIKILELTQAVSGEYCGKLLSDFGAEIIKLEDPVSGSPTRHMAPLVSSGEETGRSGLFAYLNTNKRSVALDITSDSGLETLNQLLEKVDVVITDRSGQWLDSVGLNAELVETRFPHLVVCSITPFGLGIDEPMHAEDLNVFHSSGWGFHTPSAADPAREPLKGAGQHLPSYEAGLDAAMCIVSVLFAREESQLGQWIDISTQAVLASRADYVLGQMIAGDMNVSNDRKAYDLHGPADIYTCADGYVYIWMSAPAHWEALGKMLGSPAWMEDFPANWLERECTPERVAKCRQHVGEWLAHQNKAEVAEVAQKLGLILVPVNNPGDLLSSPQYQHREFFTTLTHPSLGEVQYPTVPYKLSKTPAQLSSVAPFLGEHTDETLTAWLTAEENI